MPMQAIYVKLEKDLEITSRMPDGRVCIYVIPKGNNVQMEISTKYEQVADPSYYNPWSPLSSVKTEVSYDLTISMKDVPQWHYKLMDTKESEYKKLQKEGKVL